MLKSQKGDTQAYTQLLQNLIPYIRKKISTKLGPWEASDDLIQDTLLAVHRSKRTYHPTKPFLPWLSAIIRYKMVDQLRARQKIIEKEVFDSSLVTKASAPQNNPLEEEFSGQLSEAVDSLPAPLKRAIELTKKQGLSTLEAAQKEKVSPEAMRTRLSRAYKLLRKNLEQEIQ